MCRDPANNADPNTADRSDGMTPVMHAALEGRVDMLNLLLGTKRCNLEYQTLDTGETAVILAAEAKNWLCVRQLLLHGASPLATNEAGDDLLGL